MRYSIHVEKWPVSAIAEIREYCRVFGLSKPVESSLRPFRFAAGNREYDNRAELCALENGDDVLLFQSRVAAGEYLAQPPRIVSDAAAVLGRRGGQIGGKSKSAAKIAAARANGKKGGRPKKSGN